MKNEGDSFATHTLADGWSLSRLRNALRSDDTSAVSKAAAPFYDRCCGPLLRYCDALLRRATSVGGAPAMDGGDLALDAYQRTLRLLTSKRGDAIRDESHLIRVLFISARCAYADAMRLPDTKYSIAQTDILAQGSSEPISEGAAPETQFLSSDPATIAAMTLLFSNGEEFGLLMRRCGAGARHYRQYRALALYELGDRLRDDLSGLGDSKGTEIGQEAAARVWRRCAIELLSLPSEEWAKVEAAARVGAGESPDVGGLVPTLRDTVNMLCGTDLRDRAKLAVLRHEMGRLLERCGSELWERGNFR